MSKLILILTTVSLILSLTIGESAAEYNMATKEQDYVFISTEREVGIGRSIAKKIEEEYKPCEDAQIQKRISEIGQKLASVCDRKDTSYFFSVLKGEDKNAFALPGGYVYVFEGLIEKTDSDDEIAAILGHEISHIVSRHSIKRLQSSLGYSLLSILAIVATKDPRFKRGTDIAFSQIMLGYSREDELLADKLSVKYTKKAGYDPKAVVSVLEKLQDYENEAPLRPLVKEYARTHPYLPERIAAVKQEIYGTMEFTDYINKSSYYDSH